SSLGMIWEAMASTSRACSAEKKSNFGVPVACAMLCAWRSACRIEGQCKASHAELSPEMELIMNCRREAVAFSTAFPCYRSIEDCKLRRIIAQGQWLCARSTQHCPVAARVIAVD